MVIWCTIYLQLMWHFFFVGNSKILLKSREKWLKTMELSWKTQFVAWNVISNIGHFFHLQESHNRICTAKRSADSSSRVIENETLHASNRSHITQPKSVLLYTLNASIEKKCTHSNSNTLTIALIFSFFRHSHL